MSDQHVIPAQLISKKRDGAELTSEEIRQFVSQYMSGDVAEYQMSAFAMAVYFRGMTIAETVALTSALLESGTRLDWSDGSSPHTSIPKVDKHSTGGIGDKISLVLAPLLACCDVQVPMLSGRGLGITGGTLDKLESIPGFRTDLSIAELRQTTRDVGCVITGATEELAPADRRLYALRDVTGTVPSQPLIVSSIMSKKLAENLDSLVLDVKCGSGAFMKHEDDARSLARALVDVGKQCGVKTSALVTNMHQPTGLAIGNALEVDEAIETLQGGGPPDVLELTIRLGAELLMAEGIASSEKTSHLQLLSHIRSGAAFDRFAAMVHAQGGRLDDFNAGKSSDCQIIPAQRSGHIHEIDCEALGNIVISLGGGRRIMSDTIDHSVGIVLSAKVSQAIEQGQPLARIHTRSNIDPAVIQQAFDIRDEPAPRPALVLDRLD